MGFSEVVLSPEFSSRFCGLAPKAWLCVGSGFVREELKESLLKNGHAFVADVVLKPQDLCVRVISAFRAAADKDHLPISQERVLGSLARQEVLRLLLQDARVNSRMPEMKRLRRQKTFFKKLDRCFQTARMSFAHYEEESVYCERLAKNPIRTEIQALAQAYEIWLQASDVWDPPLLMRTAAEILKTGLPDGVRLPEELILFSAQVPESLEQDFWESLGRYTKITRVGPLDPPAPTSPSATVDQAPEAHWQRWHTLDDAAEALAEKLVSIPASDYREHAVLIPDHPSVRRSLRRVFEAHGIPLADPRDPTRLRWDEGIKWALLPLEVVSTNFERASVTAWLQAHLNQAETTAWLSEINARGIRQGLSHYARGSLASVHSHLCELQAQFGGRKTCSELGELHLKYLRSTIGMDNPRAERLQWLIPFFEEAWESFCRDMTHVGQHERRAPLLYWMERLQSRMDEATPPPDQLRPRDGIQLYRLSQAPLVRCSKVWLFGLPPEWLVGDGVGDSWFSEREREILGGEFAIRSSVQVRAERLAVLKAWLQQAEQVTVLDAQYDWDGRERDTLLPALRELGLTTDLALEAGKLQELGSHRRWLKSYGALRPMAPSRIKLAPLSFYGVKQIRATELDRYSRCSFQGLAGGRWKLWDSREPGSDLWPEVRGNILHAAIRILMTSVDSSGKFTRTTSDALEEAWKAERPKGLLKGERLARHAKSRMLLVLDAFCEREREYVERSGAKVMSLEGPELRIKYPDFDIVGIPDRIDEHESGIFIMDYKSSSLLPNGKEMLEQGYRLQLPFYALAAQNQLGKKASGVQFVELDRKGTRSKGIFFSRHNGKEPGRLTNTRSKLSVFELEPDDAWSQAEVQLEAHARAYFNGEYDIAPKKEKTECLACTFADLCGRRRKGSGETEGEASDE